MKIKIEAWSHCSGDWEHYKYFDTQEEFEAHILRKGYDRRFFRVSTYQHRGVNYDRLAK